MNKKYVKYKIQFLSGFAYLWNVVFTWIDNTQLKIWLNMTLKVHELQKDLTTVKRVDSEPENIYNISSLKSWDD